MSLKRSVTFKNKYNGVYTVPPKEYPAAALAFHSTTIIIDSVTENARLRLLLVKLQVVAGHEATGDGGCGFVYVANMLGSSTPNHAASYI